MTIPVAEPRSISPYLFQQAEIGNPDAEHRGIPRLKSLSLYLFPFLIYIICNYVISSDLEE